MDVKILSAKWRPLCHSLNVLKVLLDLVNVVLTHWGWDKMTAILPMPYSDVFSWLKNLKFKQNYIKICSSGSYWQYVIIGSDNGLVSDRRQTIIWTNGGLVCWHSTLSLHHFSQIMLEKQNANYSFAFTPNICCNWYDAHIIVWSHYKLAKYVCFRLF